MEGESEHVLEDGPRDSNVIVGRQELAPECSIRGKTSEELSKRELKLIDDHSVVVVLEANQVGGLRLYFDSSFRKKSEYIQEEVVLELSVEGEMLAAQKHEDFPTSSVLLTDETVAATGLTASAGVLGVVPEGKVEGNLNVSRKLSQQTKADIVEVESRWHTVRNSFQIRYYPSLFYKDNFGGVLKETRRRPATNGFKSKPVRIPDFDHAIGEKRLKGEVMVTVSHENMWQDCCCPFWKAHPPFDLWRKYNLEYEFDFAILFEPKVVRHEYELVADHPRKAREMEDAEFFLPIRELTVQVNPIKHCICGLECSSFDYMSSATSTRLTPKETRGEDSVATRVIEARDQPSGTTKPEEESGGKHVENNKKLVFARNEFLVEIRSDIVKFEENSYISGLYIRTTLQEFVVGYRRLEGKPENAEVEVRSMSVEAGGAQGEHVQVTSSAIRTVTAITTENKDKMGRVRKFPPEKRSQLKGLRLHKDQHGISDITFIFEESPLDNFRLIDRKKGNHEAIQLMKRARYMFDTQDYVAAQNLYEMSADKYATFFDEQYRYLKREISSVLVVARTGSKMERAESPEEPVEELKDLADYLEVIFMRALLHRVRHDLTSAVPVLEAYEDMIEQYKDAVKDAKSIRDKNRKRLQRRRRGERPQCKEQQRRLEEQVKESSTELEVCEAKLNREKGILSYIADQKGELRPLVYCSTDKKKLEDAEALLRTSLRKLCGQFDRPIEYLRARIHLANLLSALGRDLGKRYYLNDAEDMYRECIRELFPYHKEFSSLDYAVAQLRLVTLLIYRRREDGDDDTTKEVDLLTGCIDTFRAGNHGFHEECLWTHHQLAETLFKKESYDDAKRELQIALSKTSQVCRTKDFMYVIFLRSLGWHYSQTGSHDDALKMFERGRVVCKAILRGSDQRNTQPAEEEQMSPEDQGNLETAQNQLQHVEPPQHGEQIYRLWYSLVLNIGWTMQCKGEYADAVKKYKICKEAIKKDTLDNADFMDAIVECNWGTCVGEEAEAKGGAEALEDLYHAKEKCTKALEKLKSLQQFKEYYGTCVLEVILLVYLEHEDLEGAEAWMRRGNVENLDVYGFELGKFHLAKSKIAYLKGKYQAASDKADQAKVKLAKSKGWLVEAILANAMAMRKLETDKAHDEFTEALKLAERVFGKEHRITRKVRRKMDPTLRPQEPDTDSTGFVGQIYMSNHEYTVQTSKAVVQGQIATPPGKSDNALH